MVLRIQTKQNREVVDITEHVQELVDKSAKTVVVYVAHTTCGLTTADLDPGAGEDLVKAVWEMIPKLDYSHHHDPEHFPAHVGASVIGPSVTIPVKNGKLVLGTWQRIILVELDGPRDRNLVITNL